MDEKERKKVLLDNEKKKKEKVWAKKINKSTNESKL